MEDLCCVEAPHALQNGQGNPVGDGKDVSTVGDRQNVVVDVLHSGFAGFCNQPEARPRCPGKGMTNGWSDTDGSCCWGFPNTRSHATLVWPEGPGAKLGERD